MRAEGHEYEPDDAGACHVCGRGRGDLQHVEPAPRVGGVLVLSDTFPGSWGWGPTEAEAVEQWKRNGGRGARLVARIGAYWQAARVDWMGQVFADVADPACADVPRKDRPPVIESLERVGARGKREPLPLD